MSYAKKYHLWIVNVSNAMHDILPSDVNPDPKFVFSPLINKKISYKAKTFFNNQEIKVYFTTSNNLYDN